MWIRDIEYTIRQLRRSPAFTVTVVGTIGLAIAANALILTILHAALLRPLPYQDEQQLLVAAPLAPGVVLDWRARATSFASLSAFLVWDLDVTGFERPERVSAAGAAAGRPGISCRRCVYGEDRVAGRAVSVG